MLMVDSSSCFTMKEDGLPEGILFEIFLKLPWKSVNRFKCVSKVWLSIISDPNFMKNKFKTLFIEPKPWAIFSNHVIPNQLHPPDMKIPSELSHTQFLSSCNELSGYDGFSFNFLKSYRSDVEPRNIFLLSSTNGLVLCSIVNYPKKSMGYFVCNPITKKSVVLPPPPRNGVGKFLHCLVSETCSSSEIDSQSTFKVMRTRTDLENGTGFEVEIYYSDLDEWRTYTVAYLQPRDHTWGYEYRSNAITHNGVVYWLEGSECRVVSYDLKINNYECDSHCCIALDLPIAGEHQGQGGYRVRASSKCLGVSEDYVCYGEILENSLRTWVLMEDGDSIEKSIWSSRHEIELPSLNSRKISLMAFSPVDRDVVILDSGKQILAFDITTGKSEFLQRLCVPPSKISFQNQHGYSPFIVKPTLTTISKGRR